MREYSREDKMRRVLVLDTAGLFVIQSLTSHENLWTVPRALEEVLDEESRRSLESIIAAGRINIVEPEKRFRDEISRIAVERGFREALSDTDIDVVALAYQLKGLGYEPVIFSDDSFVHRLARIVGIESVSVRRRVSGRSVLRIYVCDVCGYKTLKRIDRCPVCGSKMRVVTRFQY
ncbi:MAG: hypothetical protein ABWJ42_05045 [Sulfolobales archaeon]